MKQKASVLRYPTLAGSFELVTYDASVLVV